MLIPLQLHFFGTFLGTLAIATMASKVVSGDEGSVAQAQCATVTSPPVLVASLVLPDGLGDVAFGDCAVRELLLEAERVVWLRVYPSQEHLEAGERLAFSSVANNTDSVTSRTFPTAEAFATAITDGSLDELWSGASQVFLAPWIFGVYPHDVLLFSLFKRFERHFWAMSEYGRGMGPLHSYSDGLGSIIPTGWPIDGAVDASTAVFKTILRTEPTGTDWRQHFSRHLALPEKTPVRLWWAYGRKDSASVHEFRLDPASELDGSVMKVAKIVPVNPDGSLADGVSKNMGQLLREEAERLLEDPSHSVSTNIAPASETVERVAGQFSQLLLHIIGARQRPGSSGKAEPVNVAQEPVEIIVAPNMEMPLGRDGQPTTTVQVSSIELVAPTGTLQHFRLPQRIFLVAQAIPRHEMRCFLEQCESAVIATGDQSIAEAVLLGKLPLWRPDAKVDQWQNALAAVASGTLEQVADLGERLRSLLRSPEARSEAQDRSRLRSLEVMASVRAKFGPNLNPTQQTLLRAGMFG